MDSAVCSNSHRQGYDSLYLSLSGALGVFRRWSIKHPRRGAGRIRNTGCPNILDALEIRCVIWIPSALVLWRQRISTQRASHLDAFGRIVVSWGPGGDDP